MQKSKVYMTVQGTEGQHSSKSDPLLCRNEDRDLLCYIARHQHDSEKLAQLIVQKGLSNGAKAYFKAYMDQPTQQLVILPTLLPEQPW